MKTKTKTEITVETHRILRIRRSSRHRFAWCDRCCQQARMVTADEAAMLVQVGSRAIYQLIEAGAIHFVEMPDRVVFVCLNSLANLS